MRDPEIDDGNQQCRFEFWIKGFFTHKFTKLYNIHSIGTFSNPKFIPGRILLCKFD